MAGTPNGTSEGDFIDLVRAALSARGEPASQLEDVNSVTDATLSRSRLRFRDVPESIRVFEVELWQTSENPAALCPRYANLHFERRTCLQGNVLATIDLMVPVPPQRGRFSELFPAALLHALESLVDATPGLRAPPAVRGEPYVIRDPETGQTSVWHGLSCDLSLGPFAPDEPISLACTRAVRLLKALYQAGEWLVMLAGAALHSDNAEVRQKVREIMQSGSSPHSALEGP